MVDIVEDKKTWLTPLTRNLESAREAFKEFFASRVAAKKRLWLAVFLVILSGIGGLVVTYVRREVSYVEHTTLPPEKLEETRDLRMQTWPLRRPYTHTMAAANVQEVQSVLLNLMPADTPCFHAAALGDPLDILIINVNETRFIIRDVVNVEFLGTAKGAYYHSFADQSKIVFEFLYPEVRLHFLSIYVVGTSSSTRHQRELVKSPYLVESRNLAGCIQRFYKSK